MFSSTIIFASPVGAKPPVLMFTNISSYTRNNIYSFSFQNGCTALISAVEGGNKAVVEVLLDLETSHLCDTNIQEKVCCCLMIQ